LLDICVLFIYVHFWLNFCVSGKFPETAWRAVNSLPGGTCNCT